MSIILITGILMILIPIYTEFKGILKRKHWRLRGKRTSEIFETNYLDGKNFYLYWFKSVPCLTYIDAIDITKAFEHISRSYEDKIVDVYQHCYYDWNTGKQNFYETFFVLNNKVIIHLDSTYADVYYAKEEFHFAEDLLNTLRTYKIEAKKEEFEINIITFNKEGLKLKRLDIKPTALDVALYYNDDFKEIDAILRERLNRQNDKGIVLLHGLPGTGKTTYLRYLIGELKKKVLFVSPSVAGNLMNPEFIDLLIDNPNAVVIIEDAENIIMDRKHNSDSSVSNLLNLSDGLLSDCLSVQIICTFNNSLSLVDSALMRKGRLIAKYEFGKLNAEKSQLLSKHLGFDTIISQPMTIAEIANQHDKQYEAKKVEVVGFRRQEVAMN
jgi:hypothetical protein